MNRVVLGILVFVAHAAVVPAVLYLAATLEDLSVAFSLGKPGAKEAAVRLQVYPEGLRDRARVFLDGKAVEAGLDAEGRAIVPLRTLAAGSHHVCVEVRYGGNRRREVCRSVLKGPLEKAGKPARSAVRVFLPLQLLRSLAPAAKKRIRKAVAEKLPFGKIDRVDLDLSISKRGIVARGTVRLKDKTYAKATLTIGVKIGGRRVKLQRLGKTKLKVGGPGAKKISKMAEDLGGFLGELLGGKEMGKQLGKQLLGAAIDGIVRSAIDDTLDKKVLPQLAKVLLLPEHFSLGKSWGGLKLALRYAGAPRMLPKRGVVMALDVVPVLSKGALRGGWLRHDGKPGPLPKGSALVVDLSSNLVNVLLHAMWAEGQLRKQLTAPARLSRLDKLLKDLVVKPADLRFPLVPQIEVPKRNQLELVAGDIALRLKPRRLDRGIKPIDGHLLLRLALSLGYDEKTRSLRVMAKVRELALSCVVRGAVPGRVRACFSDAFQIARRSLHKSNAPTMELLSFPLDRLGPLTGGAVTATKTATQGAKKVAAATKKSKKKPPAFKLEIGTVTTRVADGWIRMVLPAKVRLN